MKIKRVENQVYVICNCCGETFTIEETNPEILLEHQKDNKDCKGYFNIQFNGGK